jgi:hypothetical protein
VIVTKGYGDCDYRIVATLYTGSKIYLTFERMVREIFTEKDVSTLVTISVSGVGLLNYLKCLLVGTRIASRSIR